MFYGIQQYQDVYNEIIRSVSSPSACHLCILVSCLDADALCATKMLSNLFKKQLIPLQIVPLFGYNELRRGYDQIRDNESINTIIMIGFGGYIDIETFLDIDSSQYEIPEEIDGDEIHKGDPPAMKYSRTFYVLDSHRPWNLDNLFGSGMVKCLDDGSDTQDIENSMKLVQEAYHELSLLGEDDEDEGQSDIDDDEEATDVDGDDEDEDDEEHVFIKPHQKSTTMKKTPMKSRKDYEAVLETYYHQGTTVVNSVSSQVYSLLSSIGETNLSQLWLTIVGVTSLDTQYSYIYQRLFPILQDEVGRLTVETVDGSATIITKNASNDRAQTADSMSLQLQPDYYLFLLRYSSLYDGFYYSNYVNAKLSLWNDNGKKRLHKMFARMGIPLTVAKESWTYMDNAIKKQLPIIMEQNLDKYGLQDILRDGFVKTMGYRGSISAGEFMEALIALLEVGKNRTLPIEGQEDANDTTSDKKSEENDNENGDNNNTNNNNNNNNTEIHIRQDRKQWVQNFWLAWDTLDTQTNRMDLVRRGIEHAKVLQRSVFETGVLILEKKLMKNLRIYRLCVLQDGPDLHLYTNPLTLMRLGNWLIECVSETEEKQLLPLVLASLNEQSETYLVAGLTPRYPRGLDSFNVKKPILNNFSMAFQQMAETTGAQVRMDSFDSSIIEIQREDLSPFLERLTLSGLL